MRCPRCQAENREGRRFCSRCGGPLARPCPACGFSNEPDDDFCGGCGARIDTATPPLATPVSAPARYAAPSGYTPPHLAERILRDRAALEGERKQVTVLFADVSGFTSLAERLDPEDVHAVMNEAFDRMLAQIHRYEGTVNQFLGDGLMALFGAPVAHEDHARCAAHAALGLQHALGRYREELRARRGIDLRVRLGLNTGLVVVGAIGDNLRMDYTAVGDTTNVAARMQQAAEPGQILITDATRRLIEPYFELRPVGEVTVKNREAAVAAWELRGPRTGRPDGAAAPLLGRHDALGSLVRAFDRASVGRGQVIYLVGEPGIGKSRLVRELRERVGRSARWLEGQCLSFGQSTAFLPVVDLVRQGFGVLDGDDEAAIIAKVDAALGTLGPRAAGMAPYLRYLLSADPGDPAVATMDSLARRGRLVDALRQLVLVDAAERPVVVVVEDLHWIDPASEEFLGALIDAVGGAAVLVVATYRPTYRAPFVEHTYVSRIALQPLDDGDARRLLRSALDVSEVPADLETLVAHKAEGNPFFVEEIGRALLETGAVGRDGRRLVVNRPAATIVVPDRVQDVIAARLDALREDQKRTVQVASVIGREFALRLLRRVAEAADRVDAALADLKSLEFVYERVTPADLEYVFKHALTQDVAYASILHARRRDLHARIGAAIEDLYADRVEERVEALAHHFKQGEVWDRAAHYARQAGDRAAALCLDDRAVDFYEQALAALERLPDAPDTARRAVDIRLALRVPLWRAGHLDRLFRVFKDAEAVATRHGYAAALDAVYAFLVQYHWAKGDYREAQRYAERCLESAEARDDLTLRIVAQYYLGWTAISLGQCRRAVEVLTSLVDRLEGPASLQRYGLSGLPYCGAAGNGAWMLTLLGEPEAADRLLARGERAAEAADHLYSRTVMQIHRGSWLLSTGQPGPAIAILEPALAVCRDKRFAGQAMFALMTLARAYVAVGRAGEAVPLAQESITLQEAANAMSDRGMMMAVVAEAQLAAGLVAEAEATARAGLEIARRQGERAYETDLLAILGDVHHARGDAVGSRRWWEDALALAETLELRPLAERCRACLARSVSRTA